MSDEQANTPTDQHALTPSGAYSVCASCGLADFQHDREPQGEPSDAQIEAALLAYHQYESRPGFVWLDSAIENMRAAIRAAGVVADEPEWEYGWNWASNPVPDPMPFRDDALENRSAEIAEIERRIAPTEMFRRTRGIPGGPWEPVK